MHTTAFSRRLLTSSSIILLALGACSDDSGTSGTSDSNETTETTSSTDSDATETGDSMSGDGDGDPATGDGDGDMGDGDGDMGDGDGDMGDGDGDMGDGDGDTGDGDGDGDGDTGDGDGDGSSCGDGVVDGNEICDDGVNDGAYGGCEVGCAALAPHCGDAEVNGPETCDDANGELDDGCLPNCEAPVDCLAIYDFDDTAPDGVYEIVPEALGMGAPAACDMANGGWTLALRVAPMGSELDFFSPHWTGESLLNEGQLDPLAPEDGKFHAFDFVPGAEIRGCLQDPGDDSYGCKAYALPMPSTLLELFTTVPVGSDVEMEGLYFVEDDMAKLEWLSMQGRALNESSTPNPNYVEVGVNLDDDQSCYDAKVRFGLVLNNENHIGTLNDAAGFGAQSYFSAGCDLEGVDSGWRTPAGFAAGANIYSTAGQIWIR